MTRQWNAQAVEIALRGCSIEATAAGTFELIEIAFAYDTRRPFRPTIKSRRPSMGRALYWCVEYALGKLRLSPTPRQPLPHTQLFGLGEIPPLPKEFLPAWQGAVPDPARVRRALGRWLQPEVEVTGAGCLHVTGPAVLAEPFREWRPGPGRGESIGLSNGDRISPLPGDWWLRQHNRDADEDEDAPRGASVDEEFCLDHVDPAVSALLRGDGRLHQIVQHTGTFDAEWVVDGQGRLTGDIGLCLVPPPMDSYTNPYTPDEADTSRRVTEALLRGLDYGRANGSRRIRIRYDHVLGLTVGGVWPADRPLDRAASAVETKCDRRAVLRCARADEKTHRPSLASVAPLRTCLRESGANDKFISVTFGITPDGVVSNPRVEATYEDPGRPIPACVHKTIAGLAFPRSEGGRCSQSMRLHEILWPPLADL
jgi:hypothetical protein